MKFKILAAISLFVGLVGCASTPPTTTKSVEYLENDNLVCRIPFDVPTIDPVKWEEFDWIVINQEIVEQRLQNGEEIYYIGLTYDGYTQLSATMQDIIRYLRVQDELIDEMESYYSE